MSSEVSPPPLLQIPPLGDSRFRVHPCLSPCIPPAPRPPPTGPGIDTGLLATASQPGVREPGPDIPCTPRQVAPGHRSRCPRSRTKAYPRRGRHPGKGEPRTGSPFRRVASAWALGTASLRSPPPSGAVCSLPRAGRILARTLTQPCPSAGGMSPAVGDSCRGVESARVHNWSPASLVNPNVSLV